MRNFEREGAYPVNQLSIFDKWSAVPAGTVLFLYLTMLSPGVFPGRSADLVVKVLALEPRLTAAQPLWFWLAKALTALSSSVFILNVFSAVCAACAVLLLSLLLRQVVLLWAESREKDPEQVNLLARAAALSGGFALGLSPAFWSAATRAHIGTFDAVLVLVWGMFFLMFVRSRELRWAYVFAVWGGLGAVESITFLWLAIPAALGCFWVLHLDLKLRAGRVAALSAAAATVFLGFTALQALSFIGSEGHRLTGSLPLWRVAAETLIGDARLMLQCVTGTGWLLNFVVLILPWLFCAGALVKYMRKSVGELSQADAPGMHLLAAVLALSVLLNASFSPWAIYGERYPWMIPYLLSAASFGWLTAYWYDSLTTYLESRPRMRLKPVRLSRIAVTVVSVLLCAVAFLSHRRVSSGRTGEVVNRYAEAVIDAAGKCRWLISGGSFDSSLLVAAHKKGVRMSVLNSVRMNNRLYREYAAGLFDDPQLGNACRLGFTPLMREWFGRKKVASESVAVVSLCDLWLAAEMQPLPNVLVFTGLPQDQGADVKALWERHQQSWAELEILLQPESTALPAFAAFRSECRRHVSRVANNLGVWLEDQGEVSLAEQAYQRSRIFEPYNVSALLNLGALLRKGQVSGDVEALKAELAQFVDAAPQLQWWSLTQRYGYVQNPKAYVAIGEAWAVAGQPAVYAACLRKAEKLGGTPAEESVWLAQLGRVYLSEGKVEESRLLLAQQMRERPDDPVVALGLARLALDTNDVRSACVWLERTDAAVKESDELALQAAALYNRAGEQERAKKLLQGIIDHRYDNLDAWSMLAGIALNQKDETAVDLCLREIQRLENGRGFSGAVTESLRAFGHGDLKAARDLFDEALRYSPRSVETLERILRLDLVLGVRPSTDENARYLASLSTENAFAPYVLGVQHMRADEMDKALPWLEKSVSLAPVPDALNDLAWVLMELGDLQVAEKRAREAVEAAPKFSGAWDTLGVF